MTYLIAGAFGLLAALAAHDLAVQSLGEGSFVPLAGACPSCGWRRGWARGTCPRCARGVGRELVVALLGVAGAVGLYNTVRVGWVLIAYAGFVVLSLALGITDIDEMRIVDRLNLPGTLALIALLGLGSLADGALDALGRALLGGLAYFVGTNLMFIAVKGRGFGYGDVKLSVQLGLFTAFISWGTLGWAVFLTAILGGLLSVMVIVAAALARRRARRADPDGAVPELREVMQSELPYGPAMIAGSWLAIFLAGIGAFPVPS